MSFRITATLLCLLCVSTLYAAHRIGEVANIKGQEQTVIHGYGIVTGLAGTGDKPSEFGVLARAMVQNLRHSGYPVIQADPRARGRNVPDSLREVGTSRNIAFVAITVTIPESGARDGQLLDVTVSSLNSASSLEGGHLEVSDLIAPIPENPEVARTLGKAWGKITIDNEKTKTIGTVKNGCRLTADYINPYIKDFCFTLVLPEQYADMGRAAAIAETIEQSEIGNLARGGRNQNGSWVARAAGAQFVVVKIPQTYLSNPVPYIAEIRNLEILRDDRFEPLPRIVIHERSGVIAGGEDVDINPVFVSQAGIDISVQPAEQALPQRFVPVDPAGRRVEPPVVNVKLKALVDSLNALKVPTKDMVAIIKNLHELGAIQAQVIYK